MSHRKRFARSCAALIGGLANTLHPSQLDRAVLGTRCVSTQHAAARVYLSSQALCVPHLHVAAKVHVGRKRVGELLQQAAALQVHTQAGLRCRGPREVTRVRVKQHQVLAGHKRRQVGQMVPAQKHRGSRRAAAIVGQQLPDGRRARNNERKVLLMILAYWSDALPSRRLLHARV